MTEPFAPKGRIPEWEMIYEAIVENLGTTPEPGTLISYAEIDRMLGRDFRSNRTPIYKTIEKMQKNLSRTLTPVRGEGYRVAFAREHVGLAAGRQRRAKRQIRRGISTARAADVSALTPEENQLRDAALVRLSRVEQGMGRIETRVDRVEKAVASLNETVKDVRREGKSSVAQLSDEVDRMKAIMERAGLLQD